MATSKPATATRGASPATRPGRASGAPATATVYSCETGRTYQLDKLIGKGGFGEVYLATVTSPKAFAAQVCIKISDRMSAWLREAYFAELLASEPRALRVCDRFAGGGRLRHALLPRHGVRRAWRPRRVARAEGAAVGAVRPTRDRRRARRARRAAPGPGAAPRSHAVQRVRLRGRAAQARRLRHRDASAQPARRHRRRLQSVPCAERDRVGKRAALAAARRRLPGRLARRDAAARRHHERRCAAATSAFFRAATI